MKTTILLVLSTVLLLTSGRPVHALAGDLDHPDLSWPKDFDPSLRDRITAVLTESPETFAGGRFVNAQTTLRYSGDTTALNRFLSGLMACDVELNVRFSKDPEDPPWTLAHDAWRAPRQFSMRINPSAQGVDLAELEIPTIRGGPKSSEGPDRGSAADQLHFGPTSETTIPFGVPCARKLFRFRTSEVFAIGNGPGDTSDHAEAWARIEAGGRVDHRKPKWSQMSRRDGGAGFLNRLPNEVEESLLPFRRHSHALAYTRALPLPCTSGNCQDTVCSECQAES